MGKHITTEDFTLPLQFLTKSGDGVEIRTKVEVVAHLEDAKAFRQKFILEPSKFDTSQLAAHLSELDEVKELVNAESAAYNAEYLCSDPMVANQIAEKLKEPLLQILQERGLKFVRIERLSPLMAKPLPRPSPGAPSGATSSASGKGVRTWRVPFIVTAIVLLIMLVGFTWYYEYTSDKVSLLQGRLSSANAQVSSLQEENSAYESQVSSLQEENSAYESQVASLQRQLSSSQSDFQAQISQLENQLSSANSRVSSLTNENSAYKSQVASLLSQNSDLQSIVNLSESSTMANRVTVNQAAGQSSSIVSFLANYAGYVIVSGTSTTTNGYLLVTNSFSGYPYNSTKYAFGTGAARTIPVLPGTVRVYFGNSNLIGGATATISVVYLY
jgi:uncharacterized protein YlxW (UPF0749 family)